LQTPAEAFASVVPWLLGFGSVLLLARDQIRARVLARSGGRPGISGIQRKLTWGVVVFLFGVYAGYFGAGAGIIALAALTLERTEPLAVSNAVKHVATGAANGTAAIAYIAFAPVDWSAALALGVGAIFGGLAGPAIVRIAPEKPLRWLVGIAGLLLAVRLATG
jgi:uncharacterized membrane protein YfcA